MKMCKKNEYGKNVEPTSNEDIRLDHSRYICETKCYVARRLANDFKGHRLIINFIA